MNDYFSVSSLNVDALRFLLQLEVLGKGVLLPLNYQYPLSAWIYKIIEKADADYAHFLHQQGYQNARKTFKFFCFSQLHVPKRAILGDRMQIKSRQISLTVSFFVDRAAEHFICGLFQDQEFRLGDQRSQVDFRVSQVQLLPSDLAEGENTFRFRTLSPLVIARKQDDGNDHYLHPEDPAYAAFFLDNLVSKYLAIYPHFPHLSPPAMDTPLEFRLGDTSRMQSRLITVKEGKAQETKIRAYMHFDFELSGPREPIQVGFEAGFGKHNALGFGMVEWVRRESTQASGNEINEV